MNNTRSHCRIYWLITIVLLACLQAPAALAGKRVALLVGNAAYRDTPLVNPPNDVKAVAKSLKDLGFEVATVTDASQKSMIKAIREFGENARQAEVALFYYSGHGMQSRGENFLVPIGANIQYESDIADEGVSANSVLRRIEEAAPRATVVILDACRDNPVAGRTRSLTKGLSRMEAPAGTLVAYATAPGTTAGDEGYYAQALAKFLKEPGLGLEDIFQRVGADVAKRTHNKQLPRLDMGLYDKVYLIGAAVVVPAAEPQAKPKAAEPAAADPDAMERAEWALAQTSGKLPAVQAYLDGVRKGKWRGLFVTEAAELIKTLSVPGEGAAPAREAVPSAQATLKPPLKARKPGAKARAESDDGPAGSEPASVFNGGETWGGYYFCPQGRTDLMLHITDVEANRVAAVFEFSLNGGVAVGAVEINGVYEPARRSLEFRPGRWLHNPGNFMAVGLRGTVSADGQSYSGKILHPACGEFFVQRWQGGSVPPVAAPSSPFGPAW